MYDVRVCAPMKRCGNVKFNFRNCHRGVRYRRRIIRAVSSVRSGGRARVPAAALRRTRPGFRSVGVARWGVYDYYPSELYLMELLRLYTHYRFHRADGLWHHAQPNVMR